MLRGFFPPRAADPHRLREADAFRGGKRRKESAGLQGLFQSGGFFRADLVGMDRIVRELTGPHLLGVGSEGTKQLAAHIAVALDELGGEIVEIPHHVRKDQQLAVGVRTGADAQNGNIGLLGNGLANDGGNALHQNGAGLTQSMPASLTKRPALATASSSDS